MLHSIPVVVSNRVNIWREIFEAEAGIVVDCDVDQLVTAMLALLDNTRLCKRLGERGHKLAVNLFNWQTVADQMMEVYRSVIVDARENESEGV